MSPQIVAFWQSILLVGKNILPYVGLVLLIFFAILVLILVIYLLYRLGRRSPIFLRHLSWRGVTGGRRLMVWLRQRRTVSNLTVLARFHVSKKPPVPLQHSFVTDEKNMPWAAVPLGRPQNALFLMLGFEGSGKSALLAIGGLADATTADPLSAACELTWWRVEHGWVLEVNQTLCSAHDTPKFTRMLQILEQMCPACPVDGLIVVLTAQQLLQESKDVRAVRTLAAAAVSIATQLGVPLPVQLVVSHTDSLRGFDALLQLRSAVGQRQSTLGLSFSAVTSEVSRSQTVDLLSEAVRGQVLLALSAQTTSSVNFKLRQALELPSEIDGLRELLQQFESQLRSDSAATAQPWLQSVSLTGFSKITGGDKAGELVFAGQALRRQLFEKSVVLPVRAAYLAQRQRQTTRAATLTYVGVASCLAVLLWSRGTWHNMDENIAKVERLLQDIRPEVHVAKNASSAFAASLDTNSLEKLIRTVVTIDQSALSFMLVPSSWFSDLRPDALKSVGEVISRTFIRARSEQLANDIPRASDAMLTPERGVAAQRIDELPAYQDLLAFLDNRELVGASMDSAERLNNQISYMQFLRFLGKTPGQIKLIATDWSDVMPVAVTQRFRVESLNSPAIDAALRQTIDSYWERLLSEAFDQHPLVLQSNNVQEGLLGAASGVFNYQNAEELENSLKRLKREAEIPSARRIFGNKNEALSFFSKAQLRLGASSVVPSGQMVDLAALLGKRFDSLRSVMLQKNAEGVGLLFTTDTREGSMQLSPDVKRFSSAYASYMSQPFMRPVVKTPLPLVATDSGQYLEWTLSQVEPAGILADALRDYSAGGAQALDARIKSALMRLASSNYLLQTDQLFTNAAHLREEAPIQMQVYEETGRNMGRSNLRQLSLRAANLAAAGRLYRLLQPSDNATSPTSAVSDQLFRESNRLLEQFESALYKEDPYAPLITGVTSWVRSSPTDKMLVDSFKGNPKELLVSSRDYVRLRYAGAALPLLEYLRSESSRVPLSDVVLRWTRLRETIDSYEKGNASNSIYELERYVLALVKLRRADECVDFLEERQLPLQRGDYFSKQLMHLNEAVTSACEQRITQRQRQNYETFANWFNSTIAGWPPFSAEGWNGNKGTLAIPLFERVLSRFSEFHHPSLAVTKYRENWPADVGSFIAKMDQLAAYFLATQNPKSPMAIMPSGEIKLASPGNEVRSDMPFRARLDFRSQRMYEVGADQIMDWRISSGGRLYTSRGSDLFQWKIGEPIEVQLRWAINSPVSPLALVSRIYNYSVAERTAKFKYTGDWALFELIEKHKLGEINTDGRVDLFFPVPTIGSKGREDVKAFISLLPPSGVKAVMPDFPTLAPLFPRNGSN